MSMSPPEVIRFLAARCIAHGDNRNVDFILKAYKTADELEKAPAPAAMSLPLNADVLLLVRENERMKTTLESIASDCENAVFGAWRQRIYNLATFGLGRRQ